MTYSTLNVQTQCERDDARRQAVAFNLFEASSCHGHDQLASCSCAIWGICHMHVGGKRSEWKSIRLVGACATCHTFCLAS